MSFAGLLRRETWTDTRLVSRVIVSHLRRQGWRLSALVGLGLLVSLAEGLSVGLVVGLIYQFFGSATDAGEHGGTAATVVESVARAGPLVLVAMIMLFFVAKTMLSSLYSIVEGKLSAAVADDVRTALYQRFVGASYAYIADRGTGALLNILEWESQSVPDAIGQVASIIMDLCAIAIYAALVLTISWQVAGIAALLGTLLLPLGMISSAGIFKKSERLRQSYQDLTDITVSTIEALRTLKLFGAENAAAVRQRSASMGVAHSSIMIAKLQAYRSPLRKLGLLLLAVIFLLVVRERALPRESTLAVVAIVYSLRPHIAAIEQQMMNLSRNAAALRNTLSALALEDEVAANSASVPFHGQFDQIRFEDVSFSHPGAVEPSLAQIDLTLRQGAFIAVTGPSGGGKTTLINLLGRLYEPTSGRLLVDDRWLRDIPHADWLRTVAFAGQDVELLTGTILDNMRLGNPALCVADAWEALTIAQAASFVRAIELGIDARVGDRGTKLSGGQRQRLVLARALARRPQLLVLDEATNAVDPEMEQDIYREIRRARPHLTILTITHRGDTSLADTTVVIDRGRVNRVIMGENTKRAWAS